MFYVNSTAQSFQLLDSNDVNIGGTTYYAIGSNSNLDHTKFNVKNLTNSSQKFGVKVRQEYSPYSYSHLMLCIDLDCFSANTALCSTQTINASNYPVSDSITANSNFDLNFDIRPATWPWVDCPNDSSIWQVIIYNQTDTSDTTSARIIYRCSNPPLPTSVVELSQESRLNAFPNPTNSTLTFNSKIKGRLYNILGKEVLLINGLSEIDISHLTKGVYFLKTKDSTTKVLKQ